jgi:hypothetical protein
MKNEEKKYGSSLSIDERVKLFNEWLEDGGIKTIRSVRLLEDLMKVKADDNGKVIRETVSPLVNAAMLAYEGSQITAPFGSEEFLSEYGTTLQKSLYFDQENIDTAEQFDKLFEELKNKKDTLFRGVREAKWRLYSSLQRHWATKKLYDADISYQEFLERLVDKARNERKGTLSKFLSLNRIDPDNDIAVLSFLQHYGCPTPLLDWTYSFLNSLYFALDGIEFNEGPKEIDHYFSVYHIEEQYFRSSNLKGIIEEGLKGEHEKLKAQVIENSLKEGVEENQIGKIFSEKRLELMAKMMYGKGLITHLTKIKHLIDFPISYFSDFDTENDLQFSLNNNMNIVNQHGAFTWNTEASKPLEQMGNEQVAEEHGSADDYKFCSCYNIHKSLSDHVKKRLEEEGIVKDYIYPNPSDIAWNSFEESLKLNEE